jgi:hypothetical protein
VAAASKKRAARTRSAKAAPAVLLPIYGATIFLSAGLLFSVQPLFAKIVLPTLGGSPSVWSVALVFFQAALLAGYLYAHLLTRYLPGKQSVVVHLIVMIVAVMALPLGISSGWGRPPSQLAELWLIGLFTVSIGLPFFALSANAPLLQAWFARTGHPSAGDPYFLYAASNVGSFLALLSYPFLVEPFTRLTEQRYFWSALFLLLIAMIAVCGYLLLRSRDALPNTKGDRAGDAAPTRRDALIWIGLAAVPSAFLVAVTAHISTDVAAVPLLWVVPLALYLLTFVLVFQTKRLIPHEWFVTIQPALIALLIALLIFSEFNSILIMIGANLAAFFVTAMVAHGELARRRPAARHLTEFYLWLSVGGVIGGIFAGLIAPHIFNWVIEYPLLMIAGLLCRPGLVFPKVRQDWLPFVGVLALLAIAVIYIRTGGTLDATAFRGMIGAALVIALIFLARETLKLAGIFACLLVLIYAYQNDGANARTVRSFFGVHKIYELTYGVTAIRVLMHGTTIHGAQLTAGPGSRREDGKPATVTYFGPQSPMAQTFDATKANKGGPIRVAVVGLGAGTVACFLRPEDKLDFYEIDQAVVRIAFNPRIFEFVSSCKPDARVVLGDARLTLEDALDGSYDLIVMDAFTSDAIPVHLMTREAMALYLRKLAPGGMVVSHVMNRHMELASVVAGVAAANGLVTRTMYSGTVDSEQYLFGSSVAAVARKEEDFGALLKGGNWRTEAPDPEQWIWTDDYSNIFGAMLRLMRQ